MARALLLASDDAGLEGLWVTDGTAAGTYELTGITGAITTTSSGPFPALFDLTAFQGEVLFDGTNTAGQHGLWVSDGTAAGTHEVTGIAGAYSGGVFPAGFTVVNGKVLFDGENAAGEFGLWATDGTATVLTNSPASRVRARRPEFRRSTSRRSMAMSCSTAPMRPTKKVCG